MKISTIYSVVVAGLVLLSGCGGGGNSSSGVNGTKLTGVFIDAPVEGLGYKCSEDAVLSFTNANGELTCLTTETVSFYIGDLKIGSALMSKIITPYSLYENNENGAVNVARLLQTIDSDGNNSNGISLNYADPTSTYAQYYEAVRSMVIDFTNSQFDNTITSTAIGNNLVPYSDAKTHMDNNINTDVQDDNNTTNEDNNTTTEDNNVTTDEVVVDLLENGDDNALCNMESLDESETWIYGSDFYNILKYDLDTSTLVSSEAVYYDKNNCQGKDIDIVDTWIGLANYSEEAVQESQKYNDDIDENTTAQWFVIGFATENRDFLNDNDAAIFYIDTDESNVTGKYIRGIGADYKVVYDGLFYTFSWDEPSKDWVNTTTFENYSSSGGTGTQSSYDDNNQPYYTDRYFYGLAPLDVFKNGKVVVAIATINEEFKNIELLDIADPKAITVFDK